MIDVVLLGSVVKPDKVKDLSGASVAGNKYQYSILKYLSRYDDINVHAITALPIAPVPREKKLYVNGNVSELMPDVNCYEVPFINVPLIKQVTQAWGYIRCYKRLKLKEPLLMSYNLYPNLGWAFVWLKKKYNIRNIALLFDPPIDADYSRKGLARAIRDMFNDITRKNILSCKNIVALNKNAIDLYARDDVRYAIIDGGIDTDEIVETERANQSPHLRKNIVYSGALTDYSGVMEMIEAMKYVNDKSIVFEIYGSGYLEDTIKELNVLNVVFMGRVSNAEMMKLQREAWLLVNPRPVDDPIASVTFPSKTFEYLYSGTPVMSTRLNCYTEEYQDKMFFVDECAPIAFAEKINEISELSIEELSEMADSAKKFVLNSKTWKKQVDLLYEFIKNTVNDA